VTIINNSGPEGNESKRKCVLNRTAENSQTLFGKWARNLEPTPSGQFDHLQFLMFLNKLPRFLAGWEVPMEAAGFGICARKLMGFKSCLQITWDAEDPHSIGQEVIRQNRDWPNENVLSITVKMAKPLKFPSSSRFFTVNLLLLRFRAKSGEGGGERSFRVKIYVASVKSVKPCTQYLLLLVEIGGTQQSWKPKSRACPFRLMFH